MQGAGIAGFSVVDASWLPRTAFVVRSTVHGQPGAGSTLR